MQPLPNEHELIVRAQQKDKEAISTLYEAYAQTIFQYISYRVPSDAVAEDLTADVFLRMLRKLPEYKPTGAPFVAWLFRVAANRVTDFYRERQSSETISDDYVEDSGDLQDQIVEQEERSRLRRALQMLPEDYQTVLIMRFMRDLSHADVAAVINKSEGAARVLQHRALKALAETLEQLDMAPQTQQGER